MELPRPLEDVRLVDGDKAALRSGSRGLERHPQLRRVVPVVVEDLHASTLADELEPTIDAGEPCERVLRDRGVDAGQ